MNIIDEYKVETIGNEYKYDVYGPAVVYLKNNRTHRECDLPAIEFKNGTRVWCKNGFIHRDNDLPAVEYNNGDKKWYKNGKRHRDGYLPAVIYVDETRDKEWWKDGSRYQ